MCDVFQPTRNEEYDVVYTFPDKSRTLKKYISFKSITSLFILKKFVIMKFMRSLILFRSTYCMFIDIFANIV